MPEPKPEIFFIDADQVFLNQVGNYGSKEFSGTDLHIARGLSQVFFLISEGNNILAVVANIESMDREEAGRLVEAMGKHRRRLAVTWFDGRRKSDADALAESAGGIAVKKGRFSKVASAVKTHLAIVEEEAAEAAKQEALMPHDGCNSVI